MQFIDFHTHQKTAEGVITPRSFGIHPWHVGEETATSPDELYDKYHSNLRDAEIIGECGLDKLHENISRQLQIFEWQLIIAERMQKPVVVHCVRCFNELTSLRKRYRASPWVVHGFTGTTQLAQQLERIGIGISFGAALIDSKKAKVMETFRNYDGPFLLETDTAECGIEAVYHAAATIKDIGLNELSDMLSNNYNKLIYNKNA